MMKSQVLYQELSHDEELKQTRFQTPEQEIGETSIPFIMSLNSNGNNKNPGNSEE